MNLTAILPLAGARPAGSGAASGATSSTDGFAAQFAACCDGAVASGEATGPDGDRVAADLVTLAALASRTASSALPQLTSVVAVPGGDPAGAEQPVTVDPDGAVTASLATQTADTSGAVAAGVALLSASPQGSTDDGDVVHATSPTAVDRPGDTPVDAPVEIDGGGELEARAATPAVDAAGSDEDAVGDGVATARPQLAAEDVVAGEGGTGLEAATGEDADAATPGPPAATNAGQQAGGSAASEVQDPVDPPVAPAAGSRGRERRDATIAGATAPATARVESTEAPAPTGPTVTTPTTGRPDPFTPSAAAQRVLDIVTRLEEAPPPRVVVIETGEMRVRVGLDGGVVRLTVLGALPEGGEDFLRETADALEAGGFGAEFDGGSSGDAEGEDRYADDGAASPATASTARPGRTRSGLQL